jgi:hypothetical protein
LSDVESEFNEKKEIRMYQTRFKVLSALLIVGASIPALSQVAPAQGGREGIPFPFRIGAGYSNYATDWQGGGRLGGPAVWIDFDVPKMPEDWNGLQFEVEARDLNYTRHDVADPKLRQYTFAGGVNLAWRYDPAFHPYAKFLVGVGNENFGTSPTPGYHKDSRTFYAPAVGIDVRLHKRLWVRGNYEYQFWPDFFGHHTQNPNGFTIGAFLDFSKFAVVPYP